MNKLPIKLQTIQTEPGSFHAATPRPARAKIAMIQIASDCQRSRQASHRTGSRLRSLRRNFVRRLRPPYFQAYAHPWVVTVFLAAFSCQVRGRRALARPKKSQAMACVIRSPSQNGVRAQELAVQKT